MPDIISETTLPAPSTGAPSESSTPAPDSITSQSNANSDSKANSRYADMPPTDTQDGPSLTPENKNATPKATPQESDTLPKGEKSGDTPPAPQDEAAKAGEDLAAAKKAPEGEDYSKKVQKRIGEVVSERDEAERKAQILQAELDAIKSKEKAPLPTVPGLEAPKADDFPSYEEYILALGDHRQAVRQAQATDAINAQATEQRNQELVRGYIKKLDDSKGTYTDIQDMRAIAGDIIKAGPVTIAIMESPKSAELTYYLGSNPEEAKRIASMTPHQAILELGRIEATKLQTVAKRNIPAAPEPISTLSGASAAAADDPDGMTMEQYAAWRAKKSA